MLPPPPGHTPRRISSMLLSGAQLFGARLSVTGPSAVRCLVLRCSQRMPACGSSHTPLLGGLAGRSPSSIPQPSLCRSHRPGRRETRSQLTFLVQTPLIGLFSERAGDGVGVDDLVPSPWCCGFRFHFLVGERRSPGLSGHGVTGSVRSRSRAAARVGRPGCGKRASLGPGTLQFLCASSGTRASPGNASEDCRDS